MENYKKIFENSINKVLKGETLKNAMDFSIFLKENEIVVENINETLWIIGHKDKNIYIHIDGAIQKPGPWTIWFEGDFSNECEDFNKNLMEIAWENVNFCGNCGSDCSPGKNATIFNRQFENVCSSVLAFTNPDIEALNSVKMLVKYYFCN
jgi:hypothetical protein